MFKFTHITLHHYRCFEQLHLTLEPDLTVLFAENGQGKSALLSALALGMATFQPRTSLKLGLEDVRALAPEGSFTAEPVGPCSLAWRADIGAQRGVEWSLGYDARSQRRPQDRRAVEGAMEQLRVPGARWPLFAWYGTSRMARRRARPRVQAPRDRWEGYASALDPELDDGPLLEWLLEETLDDATRAHRGEPQRFLDRAVLDVMARAVPGVESAWFEARSRAVALRLSGGALVHWRQLSDGYHVFLSLVADLARRAVMLNGGVDQGLAPERLPGVVLIDEIDLHLHPRWQRMVLSRLRAAFPELQFVVTTHSPQVLSSALNRQVRLIQGGAILPAQVEGRDSNAILRDLMSTTDRDESGAELLSDLYRALDDGRTEDARAQLDRLRQRWGGLDPEVVRAEIFLEEEG